MPKRVLLFPIILLSLFVIPVQAQEQSDNRSRLELRVSASSHDYWSNVADYYEAKQKRALADSMGIPPWRWANDKWCDKNNAYHFLGYGLATYIMGTASDRRYASILSTYIFLSIEFSQGVFPKEVYNRFWVSGYGFSYKNLISALGGITLAYLVTKK